MTSDSVAPESTGRGLSEPFMKELLGTESTIGLVLDHVKKDGTLALEIRNDYFNIYYRGGSLAKVERKGSDFYAVTFDDDYFGGQTVPCALVDAITTRESAEQWIATIPHLKNAMDLYRTVKRNDEREYQQLVVRDNNVDRFGTSSDYYICDVEYAAPSMRFDLVAVHWPSTGVSRKNRRDKGMAVIELKVLDGSLGGGAGLAKHLEDYHKFINSPGLALFRDEMRTIFHQKVNLGLVNCKYPIESFLDEVPSFVLLLVNHDPASKKLFNFLNDLPSFPDVDLKIATACFAGCSLFDQGMYGVKDFLVRFKDQIYCGEWPAE